MEPGLDLQSSIRPGLDILGNEIIIALKKRSRLRQNPEIYSAGLVIDHPQLSLLDYELGRIERAHAELGRYTYASQEAFTDISDVAPVIDRAAPPVPIRPMPSGVGPRVVAYYKDWIVQGCPQGSDSDTFGETVTADVSALLAIIQRVNLGKYVAEIKFAEAPEKFHSTNGDREGIIDLIVRRDREAEVEQLAMRLGEHYEFDPEQARALFRWMIDTTVDIEVDYIRMRMAEG
jgi:chorismate mutase